MTALRLGAAVALLLPGLGCASPAGAHWAVADFDKYDFNYAPFPVDQRLFVWMVNGRVSRWAVRGVR